LRVFGSSAPAIPPGSGTSCMRPHVHACPPIVGENRYGVRRVDTGH
jgi:hypothetical protein